MTTPLNPGSAARAALTPQAGESVLRVSFVFEGTQEVSRKLRALDARASDWTPAWPAVDDVFRRLVKQQAASEGAHGGEPWTPLARSTQRERKRLGYGPAHPILRRTGALVRSLTEPTGDTISVHADRYYAIGTGVPYFVYHQSVKPRTRLPRRALVQFTFDDRNALMQPLRAYLMGGDPGPSARSRAALQARFAPTTGGLP